jgi:hypothetical protein
MSLTICLEPPRIPGVTFSVWADITCGEPCWHAREDECRCSCGGKNHGCLRVEGAEQPTRTAKIGGERYELLAVGARRDIIGQAQQINGQQFRSIDRAECVIGNTSRNEKGERFSESDIEDARAKGIAVWWNQYHYAWSETDDGAPARVKYASKDQIAKWPELAGYRDSRDVCLLWKRITMPPAPATLRIDKQTGQPSAAQSPNEERTNRSLASLADAMKGDES